MFNQTQLNNELGFEFATRNLLSQIGLAAWKAQGEELFVEVKQSDLPTDFSALGIWFYQATDGHIESSSAEIDGHSLPCMLPTYRGELPGTPLEGASVDGECIFSRLDQAVFCRADLPGLILQLQSRAEEINGRKDKHERFSLDDSILQSTIHLPVVDIWCQKLKRIIIETQWPVPFLEVGKPHGRLSVLSHDVDLMDLVARRPARAIANLRKSRWWKRGGDDGSRALRIFAELEKEHGWPAAYYFLGQKKGTVNPGYGISDQNLRRDFRRLTEDGHEIGLHGSYDAMDSEELLRQEKNRIESLSGTEVIGGRMHYLRLRWPETIKCLANIGQKYDSSLGYTSACGFRAGTSYPFEVIDYCEMKALGIWQIPFSVMDCTLLSAMNLSIKESISVVTDLMKLLANTNGCIVLLFHPCRLTTNGDEYLDLYTRCLQILSDLDPIVATPASLFQAYCNRQNARGTVQLVGENRVSINLSVNTAPLGLHLRTGKEWNFLSISEGDCSLDGKELHLLPQIKSEFQITMEKAN